jgi:hypothetical protein
MSDNRFWLRYWHHPWQRSNKNTTPNGGTIVENILDASEVISAIEYKSRFQMVQLDTGIVMRNDYKKALPEWLTNPLARAIAAASKRIPEKVVDGSKSVK